MNRISKLRQNHNDELEKFCRENDVKFTSMQKLLESEKTKKLLKQRAAIQQTIDNEINYILDNENS